MDEVPDATKCYGTPNEAQGPTVFPTHSSNPSGYTGFLQSTDLHSVHVQGATFPSMELEGAMELSGFIPTGACTAEFRVYDTHQGTGNMPSFSELMMQASQGVLCHTPAHHDQRNFAFIDSEYQPDDDVDDAGYGADEEEVRTEVDGADEEEVGTEVEDNDLAVFSKKQYNVIDQFVLQFEDNITQEEFNYGREHVYDTLDRGIDDTHMSDTEVLTEVEGEHDEDQLSDHGVLVETGNECNSMNMNCVLEQDIAPCVLGDCGCSQQEISQEISQRHVQEIALGYRKRDRKSSGNQADCRAPRDMGALETALRTRCDKLTESIFEPIHGIVFDSKEEGYEFYNMYSWESGSRSPGPPIQLAKHHPPFQNQTRTTRASTGSTCCLLRGAAMGSRVGSSSVGEAQGDEGIQAQSGCKEVNVNVISMLKKVMEEIKGPVPEVQVVEAGGGLNSFAVGFDASKIPCEVVQGLPQGQKWFKGDAYNCPRLAAQDAVLNVLGYLGRKFGIQVKDWSSHKIYKVEMQCQQADARNVSLMVNVKGDLEQWKSAIEKIGVLAESSVVPNRIADKLIQLKAEASAACNSVTNNLLGFATDCDNYKAAISQNTVTDGMVHVKIPPKHFLNELLVSMGLQAAKYTTISRSDEHLEAKCKIKIAQYKAVGTSGVLEITGYVQSTSYEAECSAAALTIGYLERELQLQIVDLNYKGLVLWKGILEQVEAVGAKCADVARFTGLCMRSLLSRLKRMIETEQAWCCNMIFDADSYDECMARESCIEEMEQLLTEISSLPTFTEDA